MGDSLGFTELQRREMGISLNNEVGDLSVREVDQEFKDSAQCTSTGKSEMRSHFYHRLAAHGILNFHRGNFFKKVGTFNLTFTTVTM